MKHKATAFALVAILGVGASPASSQAPEASGKRKCKLVVKVVHGHKRKVKVCPKPKPVRAVSPKLDSARSATKSLAAAGGCTVTSSSAAGTKLTLTVPKD